LGAAPTCHRDAVTRKATRYCDLDLPYVVAVNAMSEHADEEEAVDALFGPLATIPAIEEGDEHKFTRLPDGVWNSERKRLGEPTNTRVSAVLSTECLTPWSVGQQRARLIINPWAKKPLPELALGVDVLRLQGPVLRRFPGKDLRTIFGCPEGWPRVNGSPAPME
jgi:hypothetical protein